MGFRYAILGAGRQGVASAYDVAVHGDAEEVLLLDADAGHAETAARTIERLTDGVKTRHGVVDGADPSAVERALEGVTATISGLPYFLNPGAAAAALRAGSHFCDLGGSTDRVFEELDLDGDAKEAGLSLVPDCGYQPGAGNTLAAYALEQVPDAETVRILVGGLPRNPRPPLDYQMVFSAHGLLKEYAEPVTILRAGEITRTEPLTEVEPVELPGVGKLEAFLTSGSSSTCPWTYEGRLRSFEVKTLRYPGHCEKIRLLRDLGFFANEPVTVGGVAVVPRLLAGVLFERGLSFTESPDLTVMRVGCSGPSGGMVIDWLDRADPETGFTAMERCTGFAAGIVAAMQARGEIPPGAHRHEVGVPAAAFIEQLRARGFNLKIHEVTAVAS